MTLRKSESKGRSMRKSNGRVISAVKRNQHDTHNLDYGSQDTPLPENVELVLREFWKEIKRNGIVMKNGSLYILRQDVNRYEEKYGRLK